MRSLTLPLATKKGNMNILVPAVLTLILAAALLTLGLVLMESLNDTAYADNTAGTVVNESVAVTSNSTGWLLTKGRLKNGACGTITAVWNSTTAISIAAANYTQVGCTLKNTTSDLTIPMATWKVSYPYTYSAATDSSIAGNKTIVGLGTFADFWEIIVLAIVITIVIGLLLVVFSGRKVK